MQTFHGAAEAAETYSPAEEQFNRCRRGAGMVLAPLGGLDAPARSMAAVMGLVVVLWLSEAMPLAVTAMLEHIVGADITFFAWMALAVPIVALLFIYLMAQFHFSSVRGLPAAEGSTAMVREELAKLGRPTLGQRNVLLAFGVTVLLWGAVSQAAGVRPIEPVLGATLGASMGFMMPISTPPNAIVYSSGYVPISRMMRHGMALDLVAFVVIVAVVMTLGPVLF